MAEGDQQRVGDQSDLFSGKQYKVASDLDSDPQIKYLLESIRDIEVKNFLVHDFLSEIGGEYNVKLISNDNHSKTVEYFRQNSHLSSAIMENPSTSVVTEILYGKKTQTLIDEYFIKSDAGDAIRDRLIAVVEHLKKLVITIMEKKGGASIINLGSGPGRDTIHMVKDLDAKKHIHVTCVDKDREALEKGYAMARHMGVEKSFDFQLVDLLKTVNPRNKKFSNLQGQYDLGMLIGMICPLDIKKSAGIVRAGGQMLANDGMLVTSSAHRKMKLDDPFNDYLMKRLSAWELYYKIERDMEQIYTDSGFNVSQIFYDKPRNYHMLAVGSRKVD